MRGALSDGRGEERRKKTEEIFSLALRDLNKYLATGLKISLTPLTQMLSIVLTYPEKKQFGKLPGSSCVWSKIL